MSGPALDEPVAVGLLAGPPRSSPPAATPSLLMPR
jgi:hypothetical protein